MLMQKGEEGLGAYSEAFPSGTSFPSLSPLDRFLLASSTADVARLRPPAEEVETGASTRT